MRWRSLFAIFAVYGVAAFPAALAPDLGRDPAVLTVPFCAGFAVGFLPLGALADRVGHGSCVAAGLAALAALGLLLPLAESGGALVALRTAQGVAAAALPPAAQALLAAGAGAARTGRGIGGMFVAVAAATLGTPVAAAILADAVGWQATAVVLGALVPAAGTAIAAPLRRQRVAAHARGRLPLCGGLLAAYAVAALVLAAYWTLLTRLGAGRLELNGAVSAVLAPAAGIVGATALLVAASATDRLGPRRPMLGVLLIGGIACAAGAAAGTEVALAVGVVGLLTCYWSYLPVVSVQVVRSSPTHARATALGGLYASMWAGAALGGAAALAAPDARALLAGAAALWLAAAAVAACTFTTGRAA